MRRPLIWIAGVVALLVFGFASVPTAQAQKLPFDELVRRAQAEGEVTMYTTSSRESAEGALKAFEEKYGIRVNLYAGATSEIAQKIAEETAARRVVADVLLAGAPAISDLEAMGVPFARLDFSEQMAFYPEYSYSDRWAYVTAIGVFILYNTDLVPAEHAPQSWDDLLDPRWKGKMVLPDPAGSNTPLVWLQMMLDIRGEEYLRKLGEQDLRILPEHGAAAQAVASGEVAISVENLSDRIRAAEKVGAPVAYTVPKPTFLLPRQIAVTEGAPHPHAARLLFEFIMSEEGQKLFNVEWGQYSYRIGLEHPDMYPIDQIEQWFPDWDALARDRRNLLSLADRLLR